MDLISEYKLRCKQKKIEDSPIDTSDLYNTLPIQYNERAHYTFTQRYRRKYHFGEIFNRILCIEKNKPDDNEVESIRSRLNSNYSMNAIYKVANYNQRKHLVYIWHTLNDQELPRFTSEISQQKDIIMCHLNAFYGRIGTNKSFKYQLVIDVICEHFKFDTIRSLLYFKNNEKRRMKVKEVLEFSKSRL